MSISLKSNIITIYAVSARTIYRQFIKPEAKKAIIINCERRRVQKVKNPKLKISALILALLLVFCGCSTAGEEDGEEIITDFSYDMLDLSTLVDKIYAGAEISDLTFLSVEVVDDYQTLSEQYYLDLSKVIDYEIRSAEGKYGVADVAILRVEEGAADEIMASLENRRDDRINEFSRYDVYDSYEIALNATIYQADELVVMLMLDENSKAAAMETIDSFLP